MDVRTRERLTALQGWWEEKGRYIPCRGGHVAAGVMSPAAQIEELERAAAMKAGTFNGDPGPCRDSRAWVPGGVR